jgi:arginine:ornithine antiporter/lysine permease
MYQPHEKPIGKQISAQIHPQISAQISPQPSATELAADAARVPSRKFGLPLLTGIVIASMIGGGAFNLPQNMASGAGLGAVLIAWLITMVGMFFLTNTFRTLADKRPDLKAGIYSYAREGFGPFAGFAMAWGYWLSCAFGNVAFAILIMKTLGFFVPSLLVVDSWQSIVGASALIWVMHFLVLYGVKRAATLTVVASIVNVTTIVVALCAMALAVKGRMFTLDFWGQASHLGSVMGQVKSTMLVTLWVFIGIEGAVVVSDRAKKVSQVGMATFFGLLVCTALYFLLSALPFGILTQHQLAGLDTPSAAYVLKAAVGNWGAVFVIVALLVSLLSCWLAWTILVGELPYQGAKNGVFPRFLAEENRFHAPAASLWLSSAVMQAVVFVVLFAHNAWMWLISVTGIMILPPYLASALFLWRFSGTATYVASKSESAVQAKWSAMLTAIYSLWLMYAAGLQFLLMSTILFAVGIPVFYFARRENAVADPVFTVRESWTAAMLCFVAVGALALFVSGRVQIA